MTVYKPFDKDLYNKYDPVKELIIQYFEKNGHSAKVNVDRYGIDLIIDDKYYCDVQVKSDQRWKNKFPFSTVHVEPRKGKYLNLDKPVMFCYVNYCKTHAIFVFGKDIKKSDQTEVSNREVADGEMFWDVPLEKCKLVKLGV